MEVVLYARVSSDEQRRDETIRTQIEFLERYCALHGLNPVATYADDGVTGTLPLEARPQGARLLAECPARSLLVYRLDRLGRSPRVILNAVADLEAAGIVVRSATEPFDTANSAGRFMLTMLSGVAGYERDALLERSAEGTARVAREGGWLGGHAPYGYRLEGRRSHARLVPAEDVPVPGVGLSEAGVVREIFRLTVQEHWSCPQIAEYLNAQGVPTPYGRLGRSASFWRFSAISRVLRCSTYRGVHRYGKASQSGRQIVERAVPALVDEGTWQRAQEVMREHMLWAPKANRHHYLLAGMIRCEVCGLNYSGTRWRNRRGHYRHRYICNGRSVPALLRSRGGQRCPSALVDGDALEASVWERVRAIALEPGPALARLAESRNHTGEQGAVLLAEALVIERQAGAKTHERDMILDLYRRGRISAADLDRQLAKINTEEQALLRRVVELRERARVAQSIAEELAAADDLLQRCRDLLVEPVTWEIRRRIVETLVEGVRVDLDLVNGRRSARVEVRYRYQ